MTVKLAEASASLARVDAPSDPSSNGRFGGRQKRLVVIVVLLVGVGAALVTYQRAAGRAMHDADSGPVRTESDTTTGIRTEVGRVVTFGGIVLENFSDRRAVLEDIRIDPPLDSGISLVDVKVAGKDRGVGMVGADHGFPPSGIAAEAFRPLPGAIVPPRQEDDEWGVEVLMAFKLNRPGRFGFQHAIVDYLIGDKRHSVRLNDGFYVCGPASEYQECIPDVVGDGEG